MTGDRAGLERLLGGPEMAWLVQRVRARILSAQGEPLDGVVRLGDPSPQQRSAAMSLVGRPKRPGASLSVDLADVEQVLRRGPWPAGLADAVETLSGPVVDRRAERQRETAAWEQACHGLDATVQRFGLDAWWDAWCADGGLKRAARAEAVRTRRTPSPTVAAELVGAASEVLEALPAPGEPLAVLARRVLGDAHALDATRPLGRLVATVVGLAFAAEKPDGRGRRAGAAREAWAAAGVVLSNVASTVLCLGVPAADSDAAPPLAHATATALEAMRSARAPILLTLDQVRSAGVPTLSARSVVHVCENPTIVEVVAERWAASDPPGPTVDGGPVLVCTSGQPSTAAVELLTRLTGAGAECRYHGDFDWAGLRIARFVSTHVPWTPWRYAAADYTAALRQEAPSLGLTGRPAESPWDPALATAMAEHGIAVEEEAVADLLAADVLAGRDIR